MSEDRQDVIIAEIVKRIDQRLEIISRDLAEMRASLDRMIDVLREKMEKE